MHQILTIMFDLHAMHELDLWFNCIFKKVVIFVRILHARTHQYESQSDAHTASTLRRTFVY